MKNARLTGIFILLIAGIGHACSIAAHNAGLSSLIAPLAADLEISKTHVSLIYTLGVIVAGLFLPFVGRIYDRAHSRWYAAAMALVVGLGFFWLSFANHQWNFFKKMLWLGVGFGSLRLFGEGALVVSFRTVLAKWFYTKRGLAMAAETCMATAGLSIIPPLVLYGVMHSSWQNTCHYLGFGFVLVLAPILFLFLREPRENEGEISASLTKTFARSANNLTVKEALRTKSFWLFNLGISYTAFLFSGISFNLVFIGQELGITANTSIGTFKMLGLSAIFCNLLMGYLADKIRSEHLLRVMLLAETASVIGVVYLNTNVGWWSYAILNGASRSFYAILKCTAWPALFGTKHLAGISSVAVGTMLLASAIGPLAINCGHALLGSYKMCLLLLTVPSFVMLCVAKIK